MVSSPASRQALSLVEMIVNLAYLIRMEADEPDLVEDRARELEHHAISLGQLLRNSASHVPGKAPQ